MKQIDLKTQDAWASTPDTVRWWFNTSHDEFDSVPEPDQEEADRVGYQLQAWGFQEKRIGLYSRTWLYPEFAEPRYYSHWGDGIDGIVVAIAGKRWRVNYEPVATLDKSYSPKAAAALTFTETEADKTLFSAPRKGNRTHKRDYPIIFFGQPRFIQDNKVVPVSHHQPAKLLFTWRSGWGDGGNENVFLSLDKDGNPAQAFMESSCH